MSEFITLCRLKVNFWEKLGNKFAKGPPVEDIVEDIYKKIVKPLNPVLRTILLTLSRVT
jgi:hypothetical protein